MPIPMPYPTMLSKCPTKMPNNAAIMPVSKRRPDAIQKSSHTGYSNPSPEIIVVLPSLLEFTDGFKYPPVVNLDRFLLPISRQVQLHDASQEVTCPFLVVRLDESYLPKSLTGFRIANRERWMWEGSDRSYISTPVPTQQIFGHVRAFWDARRKDEDGVAKFAGIGGSSAGAGTTCENRRAGSRTGRFLKVGRWYILW